MSPEDHEHLTNIVKMSLLRTHSKLVQCRCGELIEVVEHPLDFNYKDETGAYISKESAINLSKFRVQCPKCSSTQCSNCNYEPYHIGKTCEEQKRIDE
mmetsp:Transcript_16566/g.11891  ORF Transcript_16566/g.11891 Transcript_16566/m.11891 type:complete len:98 (-) Transcript_16566:112-405(-)